MPTRRIAGPQPSSCDHTEHNPPSMRVFTPGTYEHECPKCHYVVTFVVPHLSWLRQQEAQVQAAVVRSSSWWP